MIVTTVSVLVGPGYVLWHGIYTIACIYSLFLSLSFFPFSSPESTEDQLQQIQPLPMHNHIAAHLASLSWIHLLISETSCKFIKIHKWHLCVVQVELVTLQNLFRFFHSTCYYVLIKGLRESKVQIAPPMAVAKNNPLPTEFIMQSVSLCLLQTSHILLLTSLEFFKVLIILLLLLLL